jgi:exosortase family protein XrtG
VATVSTHVTGAVNVPGRGSWTEPGWGVSNRDFPNQGSYCLTATWRSASGSLLDSKTTQFFSVPTLGEFVGGITASMASFGALATPGGLPLIALGILVWAGALAQLRRKRHWLSFYALGALGTVLAALFLAQALGLDTRLEGLEASHVAALAALLHINVAALPPSGLAIQNHVGWGVFDIGIECSALLEMAALVGLVGFYPAFGRGRKGALVATGVAATYAINVARILLIVGMISALGTGWVFIAHAVVGRVFFFTGVVVVYWLLVTTPTVGWVSRKLSPAPAEDSGAEDASLGGAA